MSGINIVFEQLATFNIVGVSQKLIILFSLLSLRIWHTFFLFLANINLRVKYGSVGVVGILILPDCSK